MLIGILSLILTIVIFVGTKGIYQKYKTFVLPPVLIVPAVLILLMILFRIPYADYDRGAHWLTKMLGPATVALAVPLYKNLNLLRKYFAEIMAGVFSGALAAILTSLFFSILFGLNRQSTLSMLPRSVTTPIAINISAMIGGEQSLTAVFVILTGLAGLVVGPLLIKLLKIRSSVAKGVLLGTASHACGISKALEYGGEEATIAGLSMIITAGFSLVLAPVTGNLLHSFLS